MMRKAIFPALVCAALLPWISLAAEKNAWACYIPSADGGEFKLTGETPLAFQMNFTRTENGGAKAWAAAIVNVNQKMWSQNKLVFSCRGLGDNAFTLNPAISFDEGKTSVLKGGRLLTVKGSAWRDVVMNLDSDFRLGDASYNIRQLKFHVDISDWKPGQRGGLEVRNIRFCTPSEVSLTSGMIRDILVCPKKTPASPVPADALRIYFHFDNEDMIPVPNDWKGGKINDAQQYPGFRDELLETVRDQAVVTDNLDQADLIVYASCLADPKAAAKIAEKVRGGTPLLVASDVADPEIAELLPCALAAPAATDLPPRKSLRFADDRHPLNRNGGLNPAKFGIYRTVTLKNGTPLLLFEDGTPAVVEGKAGNGRVIYSTLSAGANVIPGKKAFDAFTLRLFGYLTGRELREEPEEAVRPDAENWYEGAGKNNFGRFGWELGDGLLTESMGTKLNVTNGIGEYEFSPDRKDKLSLFRWNFTGVANNKKAITWNVTWSDIGTVTLETAVKIPAAWKGQGKKLFFHVEKGIDDLAAVYFNGVKLGEVTESVPQYWMTPHRYEIPQELLRFGESNQVRIVSRNLRGNGGFGSCPEIVTEEPPKQTTLVVDRINHIGKGGEMSIDGKRTCRFDTSLAFPGIRWEFYEKSVVMSLYNIANFAAFPTRNGIRILDLAKADAIPTDWSAPWLLLFGGNDGDNPLLLVFQHKMESAEIIRNGDGVGGLALNAKTPIGVIVPVWINGAAPADTRAWKEALPDSLTKQIAFWTPRAFRYPESCREDFRIDRPAKRVEIRDTFRYLETRDDWNTARSDYAPVPPLASFTKGILFESNEAQPRSLATTFGYFADRDGADTVHWSLPLPEPDLSLLPHTKGFPEWEDLANRHFAGGVQFSAGGGTKYEAWNAGYPSGKGIPWVHNLNMHGFLMGLPACTENPFLYTPENQKKMRQRLRVRLFEPLERDQYKMVCRWRQEPYSGIRYTVYMNSPREMSTRYAPGFGSKIIYGDSNETVQMMLTGIQRMADRFGQRDLVPANWNAIKRHIASYLLVQDDWCNLASGCVEYGGSWCIDMLNCEYSSMIKLARLAEIAGDDAMRDQALYRAARRMVPTVGRLYLHSYAAKNRLLANPEQWSVCLGFGEAECKFRRFGANVRDVELYDMSQGIPRDLIALYAKYGGDILDKQYLSDVRKSRSPQGGYSLAAALAIGGSQPDAELLAFTKMLTDNKYQDGRLCNDWGGMCTGAYLEYVLFRLKGKVLIDTAKDLDLHHAVYDPETKEFSISFTAGDRAELVLKSPLRLQGGIYSQDSDGTIRIPVRSGPGDLRLKFQSK